MTDLLARLRNMLKRPWPSPTRFESREAVERAIGFGRIREQLWPQLNDLDDWETGLFHYLLDVYFDGGFIYAIIQAQGKLFRADVSIVGDTVTLGELLPVTELFVPVVGTQRQITRVFEQADGRFRWLSISATAFLNRVQEIDSTALFDSFVAHATETGEFPYRTFLHEGEMLRTGQADLLAREGYVYITSGLYEQNNPLAMIEIMAFQNNPERWGESIGYLPDAPPEMMRIAGTDISVPVYTVGRHVEISTCLRDQAANWFTIPFIAEVKRMNAALRATLEALMKDASLPEDERADLLTQFGALVDGVNERATEPGAIARTQTQAPETTEPDTPAEGLVVDESVIRAIVAELEAQGLVTRAQAENEAITQLTEAVNALTATVAEVEDAVNRNFTNVDGRLAAVEDALDVEEELLEDMPPAPQRTVVYRPSNPNPATDDGDEPAEPAGLAKLKPIPGVK